MLFAAVLPDRTCPLLRLNRPADGCAADEWCPALRLFPRTIPPLLALRVAPAPSGTATRCSAKGNLSAIGTPVERTTNYTMLVHLPDGYKAEQMRDALAAKIKTLPEAPRQSLTWDQGIEMQDGKTVKIDTGIEIYFCDPHSPWHRGINDNTNGLLRHYFPKGTDLSIHSAADLDWVAQELNDRPRKRLEFRKPIELIENLLLQ
ncbi:IS30 family transposase [Arthrobacter sp. ISL-48]|nr:IS30 family transposase [Arthrobacter sp. ISL-48]